MDGKRRADIRPGQQVEIVLKKDQPTTSMCEGRYPAPKTGMSASALPSCGAANTASV